MRVRTGRVRKRLTDFSQTSASANRIFFLATSARKKNQSYPRADQSHRWLQNLRETAILFEDSSRCVHVGDRKRDIYKLFCEADMQSAKFLVRMQTDRLAKDGFSKISHEMKKAIIKGRHCIKVQDLKGNTSVVDLNIQFEKIIVRPPIGKKVRYPELALTIIYTKERGKPQKHRKKIEWELITNLDAQTLKDAIEKINRYALLRTAERLAN